MKHYAAFLERKKREYGDKFDPSDLAPQFIPFYESDARIEVRSSWGTRRGRVDITTGWKPVFLLMHRRSDHGSSDVLHASDTVVKVVAS